MCSTAGGIARFAAPIAPEFTGHDDLWHGLAPFQKLAKECLDGLLITPVLHRNIEDISLMIHRPPGIVALALDRQTHTIERRGRGADDTVDSHMLDQTFDAICGSPHTTL